MKILGAAIAIPVKAYLWMILLPLFGTTVSYVGALAVAAIIAAGLLLTGYALLGFATAIEQDVEDKT